MMNAPLCLKEQNRLDALYSFDVLDTPPEQAFDAIVELAATFFDVSIAIISLVDRDRQWFKAVHGLSDISETPRQTALCAHAILKPDEILEIADARADPRFCETPLVTGPPYICFYAGAPLVTEQGQALGALCIIDRQPRTLSDQQRAMLRQLVKIVVSLLDVHKEKMSATRLGIILDRSFNEVYIFDQETLRFLHVNESAQRNLDYTMDQLAQMTPLDLKPSYSADDFERLLAPLRSGERDQVVFETYHRRRDGSTYPVEARLQLSRSDSKPMFVAIVNDISKRKQAEATLRESEQRHRMLYNDTPVMLHSLDSEGRIISVSDYWLMHMGYERNEVVGRVLTDFMVEASGQYARERILPEFLRAGACWDIPYQYRKKNGEVIDTLLSAVAQYDQDNRFVSSFAVVIDVTERKRVEQALSQARAELEDRVSQRTAELSAANARLRLEIEERRQLEQQLLQMSRLAGQAEVATGLLHNIGNVLNSLNTSTTLVGDKVRQLRIGGLGKALALIQERPTEELAAFLSTDPKGRQLPVYLGTLAEHLASEQKNMLAECKAIGQHVDHIKRIVAQQQMYAKRVGVSEAVQLDKMLDEVIELNVGVHHDIEIIREYQERLPELMVDKHRLLQIVFNLVTNAKHAVAARPVTERQMVVRAAADDGRRIRVQVSDNGVGIAPEHLTKVFAYGFTTKEQGHGFGLHASANAAKELGGRLSCHSDGPDCGATFTLELPLTSIGHTP